MAKPKQDKQAPGTALAEQKVSNAAMALLSDTAQGADTDDRGNEDVGAKDMQIPRVDLLQDLSSQIDEDSESYIDGAEAGQLFNTLTGQLYGSSVLFVPIFYAYVYNLWIDRKKGGGFRGSFPTEALAKAEIPRICREEDLTENSLQIVETAVNYVFVIDAEGNVSEASIAFAKTKLSASRKLNSLIRLTGGARFRKAFHLKAIKKQNTKGTFYALDVEPAGFINATLYARAEAAYDMFSKSFKSGNLRTNFEAEHDDDAAGASSNRDAEI